MDADLDTLATAPYARIDDKLKHHPELAPWRPKVGIAPKLADAELLTLAVMQALMGMPVRPPGCATRTTFVLAQGASEVAGRMLQDPAVVQLERAWATCMSDAGFPLASRAEAVERYVAPQDDAQQAPR